VSNAAANVVGFSDKPTAARTNASLRAMLGAVLAQPELYELAEPYVEALSEHIKAADIAVHVAFASIARMEAPTGEIPLGELAADIDEATEDGVALMDIVTLARLRDDQQGITADTFRERLRKVSKAAQRSRLRGLTKQAAGEAEKNTYDPVLFGEKLTEQISVACTDFADVDYGAVMSTLADLIHDPDAVANRPVHFGWSLPGPITINGTKYDSHPSDLAGAFQFARKRTAVVGAATSSGKSLLAGAIGRNCILPQSERYYGPDADARMQRLTSTDVDKMARVLIVSTESPRREYLDRLQADLFDCLGVCLDDQGERQRLFAGRNGDVVAAFKAALNNGHLTIIDRDLVRGKNKMATGREVHLVAMHIKRWARQMRAQYGDDNLLVIIDYGQKLSLSPTESKGLDPRVINETVSSIIYDLATDLDLAMVVMLQLNGRLGRNNAYDNDIGESSGWEKDADLVLKLDALNKNEINALKELAATAGPQKQAVEDSPFDEYQAGTKTVLSAEYLKLVCGLRQIINPKARNGAGSFGSWLYLYGPHTRLVAVPDEAIPLIAAGNPIAQARALINKSRKNA
jgi:hypothetical protein